MAKKIRQGRARRHVRQVEAMERQIRHTENALLRAQQVMELRKRDTNPATLRLREPDEAWAGRVQDASDRLAEYRARLDGLLAAGY